MLRLLWGNEKCEEFRFTPVQELEKIQVESVSHLIALYRPFKSQPRANFRWRLAWENILLIAQILVSISADQLCLQILQLLRDAFGLKNLAIKTLVDKRFLI